MAIRRIHELPRELPNARLYLDDIEEISKILLDAYTAHLLKLGEEPKIAYTVGDSRMDSIDDLQTRAGRSTDLRITVGDYRAVVGFRGIFNPDIDLNYPLGEQERWAVYAKIKSVFERRQLRIKNAIGSLDEWLKFSLYVLITLVLPFLPLLIPRGSRLGLRSLSGTGLGMLLF